MEFSDNTRAILLLTGDLGISRSSGLKPLTLSQWNRLREYLEQNNKQPQDLFNEEEILCEWVQLRSRNPSADTCKKLLERGNALGAALDRWQTAGLWILTYLDKDYPWRLKERLLGNSHFPPILYGGGNPSLLQDGGLAVVGSRKPPEDLEKYYFDYAFELGREAAEEEITIISGGAKGVDEKAMRGSLESGGSAVGILTYQLLKKYTDRSFREYIRDGRLTWISLTDPEIELFDRGRYAYRSAAMQRNKYIYCLADAAVVVRSGEKGGTWSGAIENLEKSWVPLWVKKHNDHDVGAGNGRIVEKRYIGDNKGNVKKRVQIKRTAKFLPHENGRIRDHLYLALEEKYIRKATILLTVNLSTDCSDQVKPLDFKEWGELTRCLMGKKMTPADLIHKPCDKIFKNGDKSYQLSKRIEGLLNPERQNRFPQEEKNWRVAGISVLTRRDKDSYPKSLPSRDGLWVDSPALIFVFGNQELLSTKQRKITILGAIQKASEDDLKYAYSLGTALAEKGIALISANTSRIEKETVKGTLENGGKCIATVSGNLQGVLDKGGYSKCLENKQLVLLSASPPHIKSNSTAAEQHYDIACALKTAGIVVIRSGKDDRVAKCVKRCRKRQKSLIWVRKAEEEIPGNEAIFKEGAHWLPNGKDLNSHLEHILDDKAFQERLQEQRLRGGQVYLIDGLFY